MAWKQSSNVFLVFCSQHCHDWLNNLLLCLPPISPIQLFAYHFHIYSMLLIFDVLATVYFYDQIVPKFTPLFIHNMDQRDYSL